MLCLYARSEICLCNEGKSSKWSERSETNLDLATEMKQTYRKTLPNPRRTNAKTLKHIKTLSLLTGTIGISSTFSWAEPYRSILKGAPILVLGLIFQLIEPHQILCNPVARKSFYLCNVKIFAIILSIYCFALNIVPCNDAGNVTDDSQIVATVDLDHDHDQDCELCSPFCQCHCCHVHVISCGLVTFEPLEPLILLDNFNHFDSIGKDISLSLLQPPQV